MSEMDILKRGMMALSKAGARVFRNNTGMGWVGKVHKVTRIERIAVQPGDVVIRQARPLHAGLVKGSSDVIGIMPVTITSEMVGRRAGLFIAVEFKTEDGDVEPDQKNFVEQINELGGLAGIARCPEDAVAIASGLSK